MGVLKIEGITHWSIPVNDLEESERFYGELLGLENVGRLGGTMSRFTVDGQNILICQRERPLSAREEESQVHHSFTVTPETLVKACKEFKARRVPVVELIHRGKGHFIGRELYFLDPSGNKLELRDPTWEPGMPEPTFEELAAS